MHVPHGKATPSRHQNNAYCERTVLKIVEGASTLLEHAGLPSCFWSFAARFWCHAHNIKVVDGDSPWNKRHHKGQFDLKKVIPFGTVVDYLPKPEVLRAVPPGREPAAGSTRAWWQWKSMASVERASQAWLTSPAATAAMQAGRRLGATASQGALGDGPLGAGRGTAGAAMGIPEAQLMS